LTATEDKIEFSRRFYNGNVRDYNTRLQTLPTSFIAGALGFKPFGFFQADEGDRAVPTVSFGNTPAPGAPSGMPPAAGPGGPPAPRSAGAPPQTQPRERAQSASNRDPYAATAYGSRVSMSSSWLTPRPLRVQFAEPRTRRPSKRPILAWSRTPRGTGYQRAVTPPRARTA